MSYTRRRLLYAAMFGPLIVPAACSRQPTNKHSAAPLDRVTYLTGFGTFGREAFAWLTAAKGFFREVNIDCTIVPGAAGDNNLKLLAAGQAQFAVIDYAGALVRIGNGRGDFQCVAALTQHTLIGIMTLEHSRISAPRGKGLAAPGDPPEGAAHARRGAIPAPPVAASPAEPALLRPRAGGANPAGPFGPARVSKGIAARQSLGLCASGFDPSRAV